MLQKEKVERERESGRGKDPKERKAAPAGEAEDEDKGKGAGDRNNRRSHVLRERSQEGPQEEEGGNRLYNPHRITQGSQRPLSRGTRGQKPPKGPRGDNREEGYKYTINPSPL